MVARSLSLPSPAEASAGLAEALAVKGLRATSLTSDSKWAINSGLSQNYLLLVISWSDVDLCLPGDEISFDGRKWNRGHHWLSNFGSQWWPLFHFLPSKLISSPDKYFAFPAYGCRGSTTGFTKFHIYLSENLTTLMYSVSYLRNVYYKCNN